MAIKHIAGLQSDMNESQLTERLDERDLLGIARGPGVYALEVKTPDSHDKTAMEWFSNHEHEPPENALGRVADASRVAYVGASSDVYARLCDHVAGNVRKAAFLKAFRPVDVIDVWAIDNPFDSEYNQARRLVDDGWTVWTDGVLLG